MSSDAQPWKRSNAGVAAAMGAWAASTALAPNWIVKAALLAPAALLPLAWWTLRDRMRWVRLFLFAAILLPPLPIAMGDSGPHPSMLVAALGLVAGALWLKDWRTQPAGPGAALIALAFAMAASLGPAALFSGVGAATASAARLALFAIGPYLFLYVSQGPAAGSGGVRDVRWLFAMGVAAAAFACVDFYFQLPTPAGFGPQYVWLDSGVYRRAQGLFYEASTLGNFCVFFLVMVAAGIVRRGPVKAVALLAGAPVLLAALALSYSRGSVVALAISMGALVWLHRRRMAGGRLLAAAMAGIPAAAWLIWKAVPAFAELYWSRLTLSAQYLFTSTEGVLSGRVSSWRMLLDWIGEHPWQLLFGIGYKTLPYTSALGGAPVVADNMYLALLVETGIAGLAALIWLNGSILRAALRAERSPDPQRSFLGCWMFCFWAGESVQMLSGDLLTYWRVLPVYLFVLALAVKE